MPIKKVTPSPRGLGHGVVADRPFAVARKEDATGPAELDSGAGGDLSDP